MPKTVILTHSPCMDGNGSKYAAWKKFGDHAEYYGVQYGKSLPDFNGKKDTTVYMLDFSVDRASLLALRELYHRVVVIDHHKTAQEALEGLPDVVFDMEKSGAVLSWEYFHPDAEVPMLLQFVQDRDLWQFKFPDTNAVHTGLGTLEGKMKAWDHYAEEAYYDDFGDMLGDPTTELEFLIATGKTILTYKQSQVQAAIPSNVKVVDFLGYKAGFINTGELVSEKGDAICKDKTLNVDLAVMYFITKDDNVVLSMRSLAGGNVDVSKLCKKYGGGGHPAASGCRISLEKLTEILANKV